MLPENDGFKDDRSRPLYEHVANYVEGMVMFVAYITVVAIVFRCVEQWSNFINENFHSINPFVGQVVLPALSVGIVTGCFRALVLSLRRRRGGL